MSPYLDALLERTAAVRAPLAGDSPVGVDISLEREFENIKNEIDKLTGIAGIPPNWKAVEEGGEAILATRSKDMRVATWVMFAKAHNRSWVGFAEGLVIYRALVADFWDTMFPERPRARSNLIGWINENASTLLATREVLENERQAVRETHTLLEEVNTLLSEKLGDAYLGLGSLRATVRKTVELLPDDPPRLRLP